MQYRAFEKTGEKISLLGYGAMRLPVLEGKQDQIDIPAAQALVDRAYAGGVNYFDTAWPYHGGTSETFLGQALSKYPRDSYFLADKMPLYTVGTAEEVDRIFEEQLKKCRVDYFDFYLCHNLDVDNLKKMVDSDAHRVLSEKKAQGKIRNLGFSFHDRPALLQTIVDGYAWDFVQLQINYLDWETQRADLQYQIAVEAGLQVIVMEPVRGGALAGLSPEAVDILHGANPEASAASWAIRYAAGLPRVFTVLSGMSEPAQVEDNLRTLSAFTPLSEGEREALAQALAAYRGSGAVPCTGCKYCIDCPVGVDIPALFSVYNQYRADKSKGRFQAHYYLIDDGAQADKCIACGQCSTRCPQHIDIPQRLAEVDELHRELG